MFIRTQTGELIAMACIAAFFEDEHADKSRRVIAVLHTGRHVPIARDYSIAALAKALDPVRAAR
jgi:hypothetical protein